MNYLKFKLSTDKSETTRAGSTRNNVFHLPHAMRKNLRNKIFFTTFKVQ